MLTSGPVALVSSVAAVAVAGFSSFSVFGTVDIWQLLPLVVPKCRVSLFFEQHASRREFGKKLEKRGEKSKNIYPLRAAFILEWQAACFQFRLKSRCGKGTAVLRSRTLFPYTQRRLTS